MEEAFEIVLETTQESMAGAIEHLERDFKYTCRESQSCDALFSTSGILRSPNAFKSSG